MELLYKPDWAEAKERICAFWKGESIGRPFLCITAPTGERKRLDPPPTYREKVLDIDFRLRDYEEELKTTYYGGEAVPCFWPDLGPDFTSACIGGESVIANRPADAEIPGTIWAMPVIDDWDRDLPKIELDTENVWYKRGMEFTKIAVKQGVGKYLVEILDVDGGMDTAAGLRGTERLCMDLIECPEKIGILLEIIREGNRNIIEKLYSIVKNSQGGMINTHKLFAPGITYNMRSDFSYMIDPAMFRELVLPYMLRESETVDYIMFHTHTEDAETNIKNRLNYLDVILDIPRVQTVEWSCLGLSIDVKLTGIRRILESGKTAFLFSKPNEVLEITKRLGKHDACRVLHIVRASSVAEAEDILIKLEK